MPFWPGRNGKGKGAGEQQGEKELRREVERLQAQLKELQVGDGAKSAFFRAPERQSHSGLRAQDPRDLPCTLNALPTHELNACPHATS